MEWKILKCPMCNQEMGRQYHLVSAGTRLQSHYFPECGYCAKCRFLQHYEEFKVNGSLSELSLSSELWDRSVLS